MSLRQSAHGLRMPETGRARGVLLLVLMMIGWTVLIGRLIQLQGADRVLLTDRVQKQRTFESTIPARPGEILDRNGHVLAMTIVRESLYAIPSSITDGSGFADVIASAIEMDADALTARLAAEKDRDFLWIQRRLPDESVKRIREANLTEGTFGFRREYLRRYPQGPWAAHVLGLRDIDNEGRGGLEQTLHEVIRGRDGSRVHVRDARGMIVEVETRRSQLPRHGQTVLTTLDIVTQIECEEQLDRIMSEWQPNGCCAIVMLPKTGEIVAMGSRPAFDPNTPQQITDSAWVNLAVSAMFEPGSTFKPLITGWALKNNTVETNTVIDCERGVYRTGQRELHDAYAMGPLSLSDILVRSSNIGMAKIGEAMGNGELHNAAMTFGFGQRTGIELPGELPGYVRSLDRWDDYSTGSIPMGQELAVTPLQLITAYAALANGGRLLRPRLLPEAPVFDVPKTSIQVAAGPARVESRVLPRSIAEWLIRHPMTEVIERGTGRKAAIAGIDVFGKTGTSQKYDAEAGAYSHEQHICSFVGGAPADDPAVIVLVMVDEPHLNPPHGGGTVAAPAAREILQLALQRFCALEEAPTVRRKRRTLRQTSTFDSEWNGEAM